MNTNTEFLNRPLGKVLCDLVKCMAMVILADPEAFAALMAIVPQEAQTTPATQPESLDAAGALEYLNSNGYTISQGQLSTWTSALRTSMLRSCT